MGMLFVSRNLYFFIESVKVNRKSWFYYNINLTKLMNLFDQFNELLKALNNRLTAAPESDDDMPEHDSTPPSAVASTT
ncbi:unnamed protein product [Caenorhabditis auriculariae]|uniref:Uncharacterized protein n=1 Tax=Caenorhabditis auriculariae TaxID=2777116 RepID=A0A8S1HGS4_9PELO|nr:unnamed protein product [Caenorhabditis auriculariae]